MLEDFRPLVANAVKGDFSSGSLYQWKPWLLSERYTFSPDSDMKSHVESLKLTGVRETPLMEAHDLGRFRNDPNLNARVGSLFSAGTNTFVFLHESATSRAHLRVDSWSIHPEVVKLGYCMKVSVRTGVSISHQSGTPMALDAPICRSASTGTSQYPNSSQRICHHASL